MRGALVLERNVVLLRHAVTSIGRSIGVLRQFFVPVPIVLGVLARECIVVLVRASFRELLRWLFVVVRGVRVRRFLFVAVRLEVCSGLYY